MSAVCLCDTPSLLPRSWSPLQCCSSLTRSLRSTQLSERVSLVPSARLPASPVPHSLSPACTLHRRCLRDERPVALTGTCSSTAWLMSEVHCRVRKPSPHRASWTRSSPTLISRTVCGALPMCLCFPCVTGTGAAVQIAVTTQNSILKIEISAYGTDVDLYV